MTTEEALHAFGILESMVALDMATPEELQHYVTIQDKVGANPIVVSLKELIDRDRDMVEEWPAFLGPASLVDGEAGFSEDLYSARVLGLHTALGDVRVTLIGQYAAEVLGGSS